MRSNLTIVNLYCYTVIAQVKSMDMSYVNINACNTSHTCLVVCKCIARLKVDKHSVLSATEYNIMQCKQFVCDIITSMTNFTKSELV